MLGCQQVEPSPRADAGSLDLRDFDFARHDVVALDGEREICWNAPLVEAERGECPGRGWTSFPVPRLWSDSGIESTIGGRGVATYRARLLLPARAVPFTLRVGPPMTAYSLFLDGKSAGGVGRVSETAETTEARLANRDYLLPVGAEKVEILVHVANFEFRGGGLQRTWSVGPALRRPA